MPKTVTLQYPIQAHGEEVRELKFPDRLKIKQLRVIDRAEGKIEQICLLIGECCGLPESSIDQIDVADLDAISEVVETFLPKSTQEAGAR